MNPARAAHRKNAANLKDCGVFLMAWQKATRKKHHANVSAQMFCAQLQA
jgi:hypothetical protein